MKIRFFNNINIFNRKSDTNSAEKPKNEQGKFFRFPVKFDVVEITKRLKPKDFSGFDYLAVNTFNINTELFKNTSDIQDWARLRIDREFVNQIYTGSHTKSIEQRNKLFKEWVQGVANLHYKPVVQYLILSSISKDLKTNHSALPPVFDAEVLTDTMTSLAKSVKKNPRKKVDIEKLYVANLRKTYLHAEGIGENETKWLVIPSMKNDGANFDSNVKKLKALSFVGWSTKNYNANPYLKQGDIHILFENGKPRVMMRFVGEEIQEIVEKKHDSVVSQRYFGEIDSHIKNSDYSLSKKAKAQMLKAEAYRKHIQEIRKDIGEAAIKSADAEKILPYFWISVQKDTDGKLILDHFKVKGNYNLSDLGVDENKLFKKIKKIAGNADFRNTSVTDLGELEEISGDAHFSGSKVNNTGKLMKIGGNAVFLKSQVERIDNLEEIAQDADFRYSRLKTLSKLKRIGQSAMFSNSDITNLGELKEIGGNANFSNTKLKTLSKLETIGEDAYFVNSEIEDIGNLKEVGISVLLENSKLTKEDFKNVEVYSVVQR